MTNRDRLLVSIAVPLLWLALDVLLRDGFGVGTRDTGASLSLVGASGTFGLILDGRRTDRVWLAVLALGLVVIWALSLWCLGHSGNGWTVAAALLGLVSVAYFTRAALKGARIGE